ncbi:MAG TPA: histidine--tRNA ligase [Actinomycetota bacterium]|nr:histidine--tRNA ligase [Actinomycetota bacterium]
MTRGDDGPLRAPRGTQDLLPPASWEWQRLVRDALDDCARAGYLPVETPLFEHTEVFARGVGEDTDVVTKQMYTFADRAGRSLTLRPEGTAPVVRAVIEGGLERGALPVKLAYCGAMLRQERPQKGRFRQFSQIGVEAIGTEDPLVDAEVVELGARVLANAGVDATLLLNSIGHLAESCRLGYLSVLRAFLQERSDELAPDDRARVATNPLRTFDSKDPATIAVMTSAPLLTGHLCDECRAHFDAVTGALDALGVAYSLEPRLVRGLDYYTRTAFEFVSGRLGAQNAVGGGGRYDGLAEALGGPRLPGIGFALGLDRIVVARREGGVEPPPPDAVRAFFVALDDDARAAAFRMAVRLRRAGVGADLDFAGRSMKGQLKSAARAGARWAVILGRRELDDGTATVKDLVTGEQSTVPADDVVRVVAGDGSP